MKLKALLLALFVAGLSASYALADDGHGKGKGRDDEHATTTTAAAPCRPAIELELRGTLASAPTATSVAVLVTRGGAEEQNLAGKQLTLDVTNARVSPGLAAGATVQVKGRACVDIVAGTVKLVAQSVRAKGSEAPAGTTTTTTSSTTSTTQVTTTTR